MRPAAGVLFLPQEDPEGVRALLGVASDPQLDALLTFAPRLFRLFRLPTPTAPNAVMIGAQLPIPGGYASATGVAETPGAALGACFGEAAETSAQVWPVAAPSETLQIPGAANTGGVDDISLEALLAAMDPSSPPPPARRYDPMLDERMTGLTLPHLRAVPVAARGCVRLGDARPSSLGVAAGRDRDVARRAALFELIERDALAHWRKGREAHAPSAGAAEAVASLFERLGRPADAPPVSLAALPSVVGAPVVLARSDLGWGCAAAGTPETAARRAALELVGAETGAAIEAARGREPPRPPRVAPGEPAPEAPPFDLDAMILRLADRRAPVVEVDLSRPDIPVPVVKLFCAALGARVPMWRPR